MANDALYNKIQDLSDLELACLLCLINQEHCIINTVLEVLDDTLEELRLVAADIFGLTHSIIECTPHMTLDDFVDALLIDQLPISITSSPRSPYRTQDSYFLQTPALPTFRSTSRSPHSPSTHYNSDEKHIANVIIAKNLDHAPKQVQIQALELLRTKRIFTHTSVQTAPKNFLFIALIAGEECPRLTDHLNDHIFLSHFHDPEDGFPNLEEGAEDDSHSISSVVRKKESKYDRVLHTKSEPIISMLDVDILSKASDAVSVSVEMTRYIRNIVVFLRLHRAVHDGISSSATKAFDKLVKSLATLQGLNYVTPSLVTMAASKIYAHRIQITLPSRERSMQWGSDLHAVQLALEGVKSEEVIQDVLQMVEAPL